MRATRIAQRVVEDLFGPASQRRFSVRYWDGSTEAPTGEPRFTLAICRPGALRRMLLPPSELSIAEAYIFGDVDLEGDIEAAAELPDIAAKRIASARRATHLLRHVFALPPNDDASSAPSTSPTSPPSPLSPTSSTSPTRGARAARALFRFGRAHSSRRDAQAVRFHYDVGNEFYALWLDRQMVYSCAYFEHGEQDLDSAQMAKLDYVCRKLRLRSNERFLDIGCGWGALVIHAARHYGVRATGITLSEQQAALARARVAAAGLSDRVTIEVRDYREIGARGGPGARDTPGAPEQFDKIASIGMVEHVGLQRLSHYFSVAYRALTPRGLFLNHGIVSLEDARARGWLDPLRRRLWHRDQFIRRYVFPDGRLVPAAAVIAHAERQGFELRDVESLREHYVTTLRHWVRRLETHAAEARALVGDATYRVWRLYMSAAAHGFRIGRIGVIQSLLAKHDAKGSVALPRSRADLYQRD